MIRRTPLTERLEKPLRMLSLFSGVGGLDLGLERTGAFRSVAFCEADRNCRRILRRHWSGVRQYRDVRELTAEVLDRDGIEGIEAICGGFPCQDVSVAGKKVGIDAGVRSGLWREYARLVRELRPRIAIIENVPGLLVRGGLGRVLGDLAEARYDAEWCVLSAAGIGAAHLRERVFVVAWPTPLAADACFGERIQGKIGGHAGERICRTPLCGVGRRGVGILLAGGEAPNAGCATDTRGRGQPGGCATSERAPRLARPRVGLPGTFINPHRPFLGREVHGLPRGMDSIRRLRIKMLGNSVVPQVAEQLGWMIVDGGFLD